MSLVRLARWSRHGLPRTARLAWARATGRRLPYSMSFLVTHRCNFRCAYCDLQDAPRSEMSTAEICGAIDELAAAGMARANFAGGEALLRPDLPELVAHARRRGLFTSLISNGWLATEALPALQRSLDMLVLSLDGPPAVHDAGRRIPGSQERVVEAIAAARAAGIAVATVTVLSHRNPGAIQAVLEIAERLGFWAYFQPAYLTAFDPGAGVDRALDLAAVASELDAARRQGRPVGASPGYIERLARGPRFFDCSRCLAGRWFGTVMPDGEVVPCWCFPHRPGQPNGLERGFARAFREMPRPPPGPGCAISPYQEMDLILRLDPRAVAAAFRRAFSSPTVRPAPATLR